MTRDIETLQARNTELLAALEKYFEDDLQFIRNRRRPAGRTKAGVRYDRAMDAMSAIRKAKETLAKTAAA